MKLAIETVNLASDNASKPIIKTSKPSKTIKHRSKRNTKMTLKKGSPLLFYVLQMRKLLKSLNLLWLGEILE